MAPNPNQRRNLTFFFSVSHQPTPQQPVKRKRGSKREASSVTPAATGGHEIETHVEASVVVEEAIQQDQHGQVAYY